MALPELTEKESQILEAVAGLEAEGKETSLAAISGATGLPEATVRVNLSRLLDDLGLVREVPGPDGSPGYSIASRPSATAGAAMEIDPATVDEALGPWIEDVTFPAKMDPVVDSAASRGAPRPLVQALRRVPGDITVRNAQDVVAVVRDHLS